MLDLWMVRTVDVKIYGINSLNSVLKVISLRYERSLFHEEGQKGQITKNIVPDL